ncbi:NUDIX domain-containing protein [Candidatus Woesearchaeota archaeon]|nr:NUDIX domain-containing protein [Candidatus Woesearchaeota archaeon]
MTTIQKAVAGILFHGDKFLLFKKKGTWTGWQFPQGKIDKGESEEQALKREIEEETGIKDIEVVKKLPYTHDYWFQEKGENIHKFLTFYLVKVNKKENNITLSREHSDYRWCSYKEAYENLRYNKEIFKEAVEKHKNDN